MMVTKDADLIGKQRGRDRLALPAGKKVSFPEELNVTSCRRRKNRMLCDSITVHTSSDILTAAFYAACAAFD